MAKDNPLDRPAVKRTLTSEKRETPEFSSAEEAFRGPTSVGLFHEKTQLKLVLSTPANKNAAENEGPLRRLCLLGIGTLRSGRVLSIKLGTQPVEIRIEGHESTRVLKKSPATGIVRHAIERTLPVTCRQAAATG